MGRRFAFVMDPLDQVLVDKDTTFVFMLEAQRRGHEIYYLGIADLYARGSEAHGRVQRADVMRPDAKQLEHYRLYDERDTPLDWFDAVFMRKDPPFDMAFFYATHLLGLLDRSHTLVVNEPRALRDANEKLYALNFPDVIPPVIVTAEIERLKGFLDDMGGEMIIKPLDGAGGAGVFHLDRRDRNLNAILETATENGHRTIMAQKYLPEIRGGDKRLIVLDGKPLGAVLRVPSDEDHRGNIHVGGTCRKAEITARDREICRTIGPRLQTDGLYFVGLDIIGDWVTEINVTSPTGVQEINGLDGVQLEAKVIDWVEGRVASLS